MPEILLARHAQSYANRRDYAFGNATSPLTVRGIGQAVGLNKTFRDEFGITPETYERPVLASAYLRAQQSASFAGFQEVEVNSIINESDVDTEKTNGNEIIRRHAEEMWLPEQVDGRAKEFIEQVKAGELPYQIYFSHALFIASVVSNVVREQLESGQPAQHTWDKDRGYLPRLATVTKITL